jgi:hypothetical protein
MRRRRSTPTTTAARNERGTATIGSSNSAKWIERWRSSRSACGWWERGGKEIGRECIHCIVSRAGRPIHLDGWTVLDFLLERSVGVPPRNEPARLFSRWRKAGPEYGRSWRLDSASRPNRWSVGDYFAGAGPGGRMAFGAGAGAAGAGGATCFGAGVGSACGATGATGVPSAHEG